MKQIFVLAGLLVLILSVPLTGQAEIKKWVDENGTVIYGDTPPAGQAATVVEPKGAVIETDAPEQQRGLLDTLKAKAAALFGSAEGQPATERTPESPTVELYVTSWCGYCKKARAFLRSRNIPFREYDVERDSQAARRLASLNSRGGVPVAVIGDQVLIGFYQPAYERALGLN